MKIVSAVNCGLFRKAAKEIKKPPNKLSGLRNGNGKELIKTILQPKGIVRPYHS